MLLSLLNNQFWKSAAHANIPVLREINASVLMVHILSTTPICRTNDKAKKGILVTHWCVYSYIHFELTAFSQSDLKPSSPFLEKGALWDFYELFYLWLLGFLQKSDSGGFVFGTDINLYSWHRSSSPQTHTWELK